MKAGRGLLTLVAILATGALCAPLAHAGTYDVYSCKFGSSFYGNNAWADASSTSGDPLTAPDKTCVSSGDPLVALLRPAAVALTNQAYAAGVYSALRVTPPADTRITDFTVTLRHVWDTRTTDAMGVRTQNNTAYTMAVFGAYAFSLTGQYDLGVVTYVTSEGHYLGASGPIDKTVTLSKADSPAAKTQGTATALELRAGCWVSTGCTLDPSSLAQLHLIGSKVTIQDAVPPVMSGVQAGAGLLAPGVRSGNEPVTFSASDNSGIRRAELVDVTDASNPAVVASEDYNTGPNTDAGTRCDYTRPRPCPDLKNETIAASPPIAGHRTLIVRVTDAGGETSVSAPFGIQARGPLNGANGGDGARLVAGFPAKVFRGEGKKRHAVFVLRSTRLVSYGKGATIRGTLKGADGQPIAAADVRILVREARLGAQYVDRGGITSGDDGRVQLGVTPGSSRLFRLAYRAYKGDDAFVTRSTSTLNVRSRISVHGPKRVRARGTAKFSGRLVGRPFPPRGVTLDLQIFQPGVGWRVFATTRTRRSGTFTVRYHFQRANTGRFTFRIRLRPNDAYPYSRGVSGRMRVRVG